MIRHVKTGEKTAKLLFSISVLNGYEFRSFAFLNTIIKSVFQIWPYLLKKSLTMYKEKL